ncbi:MAG: putative 2-aminoethylphosphonate ABC transporter substrate-binding protein [Clostridiales Family XIII bacterium]|jgi:iron(III) transport system substrate-binding protein|nr:putative 2-aminoethylphosphonate ABC transporter substrate-binding protein [Clostridiales Family XIII bacterium]
MNKRITALLLAGTLIMTGIIGAACAAKADDSEEPADTPVSAPPAEQQAPEKAASGTITVYTALEDEQVTAYLAKFNETYPDIQVNPVRESTGVITAKLLAEKDNPVADVIWGTAASSLLVLDTENMLEPYTPEGVDRILPEFKSDKADPTWVGIDAWETAFIVNTVELEKLGLKVSDIKTYQDLLNPKLKGHIVMSNPNSSGTGLLTVTGLLQLYGKDTNDGWDYLTKLHENVAQYVHSGSKPAKMAAAGECVVGVSFGYAGISQKQQGAPVEIIFPTDGSGWDVEANALMKKSSINPAAKTFLDWAISDDAMNLYKENYPIIATGQGGKYDGFSVNPVDQLIDNDLVWVAQNRENILNEWMTKYDAKSAPKEA